MQGDAISPELALVDAELAARARAQLPDRGQWRPAWREPALDRRELERELLRRLLAERRREPEVRAPAAEPRRRRVPVDLLVAAAAAAVVLVLMGALVAFDGGLVDSSRPVLLDAPEPAAAQTRPAEPPSGIFCGRLPERYSRTQASPRRSGSSAPSRVIPSTSTSGPPIMKSVCTRDRLKPMARRSSSLRPSVPSTVSVNPVP